MGGAEIGTLWDYHQQQAAEAAAKTEEGRRAAEAMRVRKEAALATAEAVLACAEAVVVPGGVGHRRMATVPMGPIPGAASGVDGYARVWVRNDTERREVVTKGLFFSKTHHERVVSDKVSDFGVVLSASTDGGATHEELLQAHWSIVERGHETDEEMTQLETSLQIVAEHLGLPVTIKTTD